MPSKTALSDDKCDLSELGDKEKSVGMAEHVLWSAGTNISEEWKCLEMPLLVSDAVCHVYVALADGLTFNSSEMDCLLLWVALDHLNDKAVKWASICAFPSNACSSIPMLDSCEPWPVKTYKVLERWATSAVPWSTLSPWLLLISTLTTMLPVCQSFAVSSSPNKIIPMKSML